MLAVGVVTVVLRVCVVTGVRSPISTPIGNVPVAAELEESDGRRLTWTCAEEVVPKFVELRWRPMIVRLRSWCQYAERH